MDVPIIFYVEQNITTLGQATSKARSTYFDLLNMGLRAAPAYLTLNMNLAGQEIHRVLEARGQTRILGHQDIRFFVVRLLCVTAYEWTTLRFSDP